MTAKTLVVYGGWEAFGVADFSPFCLKVKTYLRMAGIPYRSKGGDPRKAPAGKIPYIDDDGVILGDSGLILDHLRKKHGDALDKDLTARERAVGHVARRTLEESLYWAVVYSRWLDDDVWPDLSKVFLPVLPPIIGGLVLNHGIRAGMRKGTYAQGIGRHTRANADAIGCADVDAIAELLGDKPFLLGDQPSSYDAVLYGFIANALAFPSGSAICARVKRHANLVELTSRIRDKYWATPDAA